MDLACCKKQAVSWGGSKKKKYVQLIPGQKNSCVLKQSALHLDSFWNLAIIQVQIKARMPENIPPTMNAGLQQLHTSHDR